MPEVFEIPLEPLMAEAFAPFGEIIGEPYAPSVFKAPHLQSWRLEFAVDGPAEILYVRYVHEPFRFGQLERHVGVTQAFVPLGNARSVMVVAPPVEEEPKPEQIRAFLVSGDRGILLWRGTWHALTRFPVDPSGAAFLMVTGEATQRELEQEIAGIGRPSLTHVIDYGKHQGIRFEITDPRGLLAA